MDIIPDLPVTAAASLSPIPGVSIWRIEDHTVTLEMLNMSPGQRIDMLYSPIASTQGYRLRCELLPAHSQIELILAVVSMNMNDQPGSQEADKPLHVSFADGHVVWLADPDHTEKIFGARPVPRLVKVTGRYTAHQSEHEVSENVVPLDFMLDAVKLIPKP